MNALTINSRQTEAHGRASGRPICGGMGHRAPASNDQPKAVGPRRNFRLGWCFTGRQDFLEIDRLTKAGVEGRVAAQLLTNHSGAQSQFQGISERHVHLPKSFRRPVLDSHDANENGLTHAQGSFAPGAKAYD